MVGAGVTVADLPSYAAPQRPGHRRPARRDARARRRRAGAGQLDGGLRRGSLRVHRARRAAAAGPQPASAGGRRLREPLRRTAVAALTWELVPEDARLDPRSSYAASKVAQEHYTLAWARQARARAIGLRYHNVYGPGMPRDTPYSGVAAIFRSSLEAGRGAAGLRGRRPDARLRARRRRRPGQRARDRRGAATGRPSRGRRTTSARVRRSRSCGSRELLAEAAGGPAPEVTGDYRPGDVRHVVASPALAASELGFTAEIDPEQGIAEFATAPLRDATAAGRHQPVKSRCCTASATTDLDRRARRVASARAARRARRAATARTAARSARPRPCSSATGRRAPSSPARRRRATGPPAPPRPELEVARLTAQDGDPGPRDRSGAEGSAARLPHIQYAGGRLLATPGPVAVAQHRQRLPPQNPNAA